MTDHSHGPWKHAPRRTPDPWIAREGVILAIIFAGAMIAALGLAALTGGDTTTPIPAIQDL